MDTVRCRICPAQAAHRVLVETQRGEAKVSEPVCLPCAQEVAMLLWDDADFRVIEVTPLAAFGGLPRPARRVPAAALR